MEQSGAISASTSDVFEIWEYQAEIGDEFADEWREYALLMTTFHAAWERAPRTDKACEQTNIEHLLINELEHLANAIQAIFPCGGIMEFATYLTVSINKCTNHSTRSKQ